MLVFHSAGIAVSVVVPCRNPGPHLQSLLKCLAAQCFAEPWEVVLVDNCCTDGSVLSSANLLKDLNVSIVFAGEKANAAYARNVGARHAKATRLLFVDADDEVADGYIAAMFEALKTHPFVTSRVDSSTLNPDWVRDAHVPWQESSLMNFFDFRAGTGSNIGVHRELFERAGAFPEAFRAAEDIALSWNVQLQFGIHPELVMNALYRYRYRNSLWRLFRQSEQWGQAAVLLYKTFREHGMPSRSLRVSLMDWLNLCAQGLRARSRKDFAPVAASAGACVGRFIGSIRHRAYYM